MRNWFPFSILILFLPLLSFTQDYQFRNLQVEDGLPSSEVYHAYQDEKGYIWFATDMGISRYDGYGFKNYDLEDGLPDNTIFEIFQDNKGRIWFISFSLKLSYYYQGKIHEYKYNEKIQDFIPGNHFHIKKGFYVDSNDNVFIGVKNFGTLKIDSTGTASKLDKNTDDETLYFKKIKNKFITGRLLNPNINEIHLEKDDTTLSYNVNLNFGIWQGNVFAEELNDTEWLLAYEGRLFKIGNNTGKQTTNLKKRIIWLSKEKDNQFWVGTFNGIYQYNASNLSVPQEILLEDYSVSSILIDHENGYWFTTLDNGVFYLPSLNFRTIDEKYGLKNSIIEQITTDKFENIWISDHKLNITKLNKDLKIIETYQLPASAKPIKISSLDYNPFLDELWTSNGYRLQNQKFKELPIAYEDISFISRNIAYACHVSGIYITDGDSITYQSWNQHPLYRFNSLFYTKEKIYLGGLKGLWLFQDNNFKHLSSIDERFNYRVLDIKQYHDYLALGTKGAGILFFNPSSGDIKQVTKEDGLISNNIKQMVIHKNYVFTATNNGLVRMEIINLDKGYFSINNFSTFSGLPTKEINALTILDSTIYIASKGGLTFSKLEDLQINKVPPEIHFENINISGKDTLIKASYELPYNKNFINIQYSGLSYKSAGNIKYRYMMKGLENDWKYTQDTEKMYTTLPPGKYTFMILAQNENGVWSKDKASIEFHIKKPYWRTWWFILLISLTALSTLYLIFHFRFKLVRRKKQLLQDVNNYKQIVLRQQMNPHFLFNTLNSIQYYLLEKDTHSSLTYLSKFAKLMRMILDNSQYTHISIQDELNALELYLELETIRLDNNFIYHIEISDDINVEEHQIPSLLLQPYVENAIHHGLRYKKNEKGKILIRIEKEDDTMIFIIEDNGIGRKHAEEMKKEKSLNKKPLGSKITEERIKTLNALYNKKIGISYCDIESEQGEIQGTRVVIKTPVILNN